MDSVPETKQETFRDKLYNVTPEGDRLKIYPQKPKGRYYSARTWVSIGLLIILFSGPFISIGGHPLLLLNILERKFVLFGIPFWPQDFHLFVLSVLTLVVFVVLFTAIFGRIWCGWLCPQTIFMEMVFRKIEYLIEGNSARMKNFDKQPLTAQKVLRKGLKHSIFFLISFAIANTFLAYIIGADALWEIITDPPQEHIVGLMSITVFSLVFYGVFARFREQACIIVCPYGRFQSVMVDENTIAVTYDYKRGEPRSKFSRADKKALNGTTATVEAPARGDCIDCDQCVKVCPTGIDIRNGIQLECVNCTACMDACDTIMDKVKKPRGLIRYASYNGIREPGKRVFNTRVVAYSIVLTLLIASLSVLFALRANVETTILRQAGTLYNELADGSISNFYTFKIINKTFNELPVEIRLVEPQEGSITILGSLEPIPGHDLTQGRFYVALPPEQMKSNRTPIRLAIVSDGEILEEIDSHLLGPAR